MERRYKDTRTLVFQIPDAGPIQCYCLLHKKRLKMPISVVKMYLSPNILSPERDNVFNLCKTKMRKYAVIAL